MGGFGWFERARVGVAGCVVALALAGGVVRAQDKAPQQPAKTPEQAPAANAPEQQGQPPHGTVLFQSHGAPPEAGSEPAAVEPKPVGPDPNATPDVTDTERDALIVASYDLVTVVTPAKHGLGVHATLVLRNDGKAPLKHATLQVSSTLHWVHAAVETAHGRVALPLAEHRLETDADHTGAASEAVLTLPEPLAPGASLSVAVDYEGTIAADASRLARLGVKPEQAAEADWDAIGAAAAANSSVTPTPSSSTVALRGFGNVLWYPVAAPQLFLGNGAELFQAAGRMKLREQAASVRLRLTLDNGFEPAPTVAYFCGRRAALSNAAGENRKVLKQDGSADEAERSDLPSAVAQAEFAAEPLGFRPMSLFVLNEPERLVSAGQAAGQTPDADAGASSSSSSGVSSSGESPAYPGATLLAVESNDHGAVDALASSAGRIAPLLEIWLGARPLSALTVIDHPGQPFEDGPLLVAPAESLAVSAAAPSLTHSLTHAWVQTGQPWMDEGLAQFFALLWTEREHGRPAALAQMSDLMQPVAMADATPAKDAPETAGQPLVAAQDEFFYRRKAAAVWWMLRDIAGDEDLRRALSAWRVRPVSTKPAAEQALAFEKLLEQLSHKDLAWFFNDWVLQDRGLPDLSIADVNARPLDASNGARRGWLVTVTVRNDGAAQAEVPLEIRSGSLANGHRIRIPANATITQRVEIESAPTEVRLNDGSVPEIQASVHTKSIIMDKR